MCTPKKCCRKKRVCYCDACRACTESQLTVAKNKSKTIVCSDILSIYVPTCDEIIEIEEGSDYYSKETITFQDAAQETDAEEADLAGVDPETSNLLVVTDVVTSEGEIIKYKCRKPCKDEFEEHDDSGSRRSKCSSKRSKPDIHSNRRSIADTYSKRSYADISSSRKSNTDAHGEELEDKKSRCSSRRSRPETDVEDIYESGSKKSRSSNRRSKADSHSNPSESERRKYECKKLCQEEAERESCLYRHKCSKHCKKDTDSNYSCEVDDEYANRRTSREDETAETIAKKCRCKKCQEEELDRKSSKSKTSKIWNKVSNTIFRDSVKQDSIKSQNGKIKCKQWCVNDKCICGRIHTHREESNHTYKEDSNHTYKEDSNHTYKEESSQDQERQSSYCCGGRCPAEFMENDDLEETYSKDELSTNRSGRRSIEQRDASQQIVQNLRDTPQVCQCCGCHQGTGYSTFRSMVFPYKALQLKRIKFCDMLKRVKKALTENKSEINLCEKCCASQYYPQEANK